ncbi:hypothetical protein DEO72_LG11g759 [Vigna unguiculata]|uniref:Uncharacterized protein n=1 Tax=Vigna unguiculata TaxID=3917 RepID=A0A4D6NLE9_VIGUN|nr:hypothetical protein DEO72_LG11g759 [Vigna unguiculata]
MGDKLHCRKGNSLDHQLRPLNDHSMIKEMNGAKRSVEVVGCQNESVGECSALGGTTRASSVGRSGSENIGLSNANVGENPMPRKPKGSSARFVHGGVIRGRENASSQSLSTRCYNVEVIHAILPGKARTTFNKWVLVPETDTCGPGRLFTKNTSLRKVIRPCTGVDACQCRKVKEVVARGKESKSDYHSSGERNGSTLNPVSYTHLDVYKRQRQNSPVTSGGGVPPHKAGERTNKAPMTGGRNYNGPKVAKFLVGLGGGQRRPSSGGPEPLASPKVTEACKGFLGPDGDWLSSGKAEGSLPARPTLRAGTKVGLSDPTVPSGRVVTQRIKVTLGITGLSSPRAHIDGKVWHLHVSSSPPGAVVCSKGWAVRPLKRYVSWVQNVVRQFDPYLMWALEH